MSDLQQKIEQTVVVLAEAAAKYAPVVFASSLGAEDMVLTDLIARFQPDIAIFSLDTGRLPQETYDLMQEVRRHYSIALSVYFPDSKLVEEYVARHGINGFYDSVESRKACCSVRKVEPLRRALKGKGAWITGMRRDQAVTRGGLEVSSFDADNGLQKFNPLLEWTNKDVWAYIRQNDVPYNKLHDRFYPSLGCAPCTRSVTPGEDIRAGRWWWENPENKECGLHVSHSPKGAVAHGFGVSAQGNVGSVAGDVSRNQNLHKDELVSGQGNVGSVAGDVSRSHDPSNRECSLHVNSRNNVAYGTGVQPISPTSLEASRERIVGIAAQGGAIQEVSV